MASQPIIRRGRPDDVADVVQRCTLSFSDHTPSHLPFPQLFPDTIPSDGSRMDQWLLAEVDGELAAGLQIVPRPMVLGRGVQLRAAGIANVFCYPPFRKRGCMSALMRQAVTEMDEAGYGVALLGGDRLRYGRFGWEVAGNAVRVELDAGMLRESGDPPAVTEFRRWDHAAADTERMFAAYQELPFRTERAASEFPLVLQRPNNITWVYDRDRCFAYATIRNGCLQEYAGDGAGITELVRFFVSRGLRNAVLPPMPGQGGLDACLIDCAGTFSTVPVGMVRVNNTVATLEAYKPLLHERLAGWTGTLTLAIEPDGETVTLAGNGQQLTIEAAGAVAADITLTRGNMARLLFGPFPPVLGAPDGSRHAALARAFPLPLYWHALSHV